MYYIAVTMKNSIKNGTPAPGVGTAPNAPQSPEVDVKAIEQWLTRDLQALRSLVIAISSDPDMIRQLAVFMHGRYVNEQNREKLKTEMADA